MNSRMICPNAFRSQSFPQRSLLRGPILASVLIASVLGCTKTGSGEDLKASTKSSTPPPTESKNVAKQVAPPAEVSPTTTMKTDVKPKSLEEAIAAPGTKTVTAVSADGRTKVIPMGKVTLAETETYLLSAVVPENTAVGKDTAVSLTLTPKTGWKINQEFPTKLKITAPSGVTVSAPTQSAKDAEKFSEKSAVFKVAFKADDAGVKKFSGKLRFAVCTDATCDPKSAEIAWTLVAK